MGNGQNQLPDMSLFGAYLNSNGYQYLPSGLIIQWGKIRIEYSSPHTAYTVAGGSVNRFSGTGTFPVTFPNAVLAILGTSNDVANAHISSVYASSAQGFQWSHHSTQPYLASAGGGNGFTWFAFGY
ncbi:gp53-like domain-containing protein [Siccibacter turicensis]|uniref:gp53-like domain-containing protein n=1 Tax=Siccibacter turicensis TaxID=357233 RepID=UPI002A6B8D46|nr:hypothetical protein [Siccibacter turicensis]MDY0971391.1 hypothetical protein [Siccibacter turicensis]